MHGHAVTSPARTTNTYAPFGVAAASRIQPAADSGPCTRTSRDSKQYIRTRFLTRKNLIDPLFLRFYYSHHLREYRAEPSSSPSCCDETYFTDLNRLRPLHFGALHVEIGDRQILPKNLTLSQ
jgi:hypothetical protein